MIVTSRRLKSLIKEEERLVAKIADLQSHLEEVRKAKKMEEDAEILKSFRSMELETWDLYNLATGIKDGEISMEMLRQVMAAGGDRKAAADNVEGGSEAVNIPVNTSAADSFEDADDPEEIENASDEHQGNP